MSGKKNRAPSGTSWRFKVGMGLVVLMLALWLCVPLAAWLDVPPARIAAGTGVIFILNKVIILVIIAVLGKSGFQELKSAIFGVFRLAPDTSISATRYNIGLVMFCLPLISAWLEPYIDTIAPGFRPNLWQLQALGDAMFIASFFVLGGNFWEKVRALFIRSSRVVYQS